MDKAENKAQPLSWGVYHKLLRDMDKAIDRWEKLDEPGKRIKSKIERWTRYQTAFVLGGYFGLRSQEIRERTWQEIYRKSEGEVLEIFQGKTKRKRLVHFHEIAIRYFDRNCERIKPLSLQDYILHKQTDRFKMVSPRHFNLELVKIFEECHVITKDTSSHTFRKTFATHLWEKSDQSYPVLLEIKEALGHKNLKDTIAYLGIDYEIRKRAFLRL